MSLFFVLFGKKEGDQDSDVKFKARGLCNFPLIREGDDVYVSQKNLEDVVINDIAVFLSRKHLISHRVVKVYDRDGNRYLETRSDNNLVQNDPSPVSKDNYVGVVKKVSRNGVFFEPKKLELSELQRIKNTVWLSAYSWYHNIFLVWFKKGWNYLRVLFVQEVSNIFSKSSGPVRVSFDKSSPVKVSWLRRLFRVDDLLDQDVLEALTEGSWQMTFSGDNVVYGFVSFNRSNDLVFLTHYFINPRFWGSSIVEDIHQRIDAFCRISGFEKLFAYANTHAGKKLLTKSGFLLTDEKISPHCEGYFEYLESQDRPKYYHINDFRWTLLYDVPEIVNESTDPEILGIQ